MLELDDYSVGVILILCRIGTTLMVAPGFSSARVPARVRLYVAFSLALAMAPAVLGENAIKPGGSGMLVSLVFAECLVGMVIGLVCRFYIAALEFMANAIANYVGLSALAGGIDHDEPASPLATLITLVATLLVLLMDLHQLLIKTVLDSYGAIPLGVIADPQFGIRMLSTALSAAFLISLQISGPFIVYGILVNVLFGILGKLIPQVASYFVSLPFLLMGGLFFVYLMLPEMLKIFFGSFASVLTNL
jgi:flagellar biosynthetic protein FliR